jgi:trehalose 6-phosphate phosphatase
MIDLLSFNGLQALRSFITCDTLFAFDLDGTLAPIVANPAAVEIPETIRTEMEKLTRLAVTAIITGRSRADALSRLGFEPRYLVGNHGVEGLPGQQYDLMELQRLVHGWEEQLTSLLPPFIRSVTQCEHKGSSLSLHYRHAPDPHVVYAALCDATDQLIPAPRQVGGKSVINLIPQGIPHKGDALLQLMEHSGCHKAFFLGDDETDEDVFRLNNSRIFSACVGAERLTAARYYLEKQQDTERLLRELSARLEFHEDTSERCIQ